MATMDARTNSKGRTTYRVRWREGGTRDGAWQSATFARSTDAKRFKTRVEAAGHQWPDDATGAVSTPGVITLAALSEQFMADRERRVRSDRTTADYRRDYSNWIEPHLGASTMIDTITDEHVQTWVDRMADGTYGKALAAKTVGDRHILLHSMFDYALARKWVDANPCVRTQLPKRQKKSPKAMTPAEWAAFYPALQLIDSDAADLALFMLATGWRWSEASALSPTDVEDYGDRMFVNMTQVVRRNAKGESRVVAEGKGQASLRRVELDREAAEMVRSRLRPGTTLVFTTGKRPTGGTGGRSNGLGGSQWHYSNFRTRYWLPAVKAANLSRQPTPHWLRHTAVVWLHNAGASMAELQSRIGHESITTTMGVYGRAITDVNQTTLRTFAAMRHGGLQVGAASPQGIADGL